MRVKLPFLRRDEGSPHWHEERDTSAVYSEFMELWEKDDGDEQSLTKRRIGQWRTGRRFSFIDHVSVEFLEEWGINPDVPLPGTHHVLDYHDFTIYRFKII